MNPTEAATKVSPIDLVLDSSGVGWIVLLILGVFSTLVWVIWILKTLQIGRLRGAQHRFESAAAKASTGKQLVELALRDRASPGARVVLELAKKHESRVLSAELLLSVAKRAIVDEQQRASRLMPTLSSIASSSPFIGLFGTVWGIMDAFLKIGVEKSASLPVVAPAIGEALIATAFGLVAAIPAMIAYNFVDQRISDLLAELEASSETWVETLASAPTRDAEHAGFPLQSPRTAGV